MYYLILYTLFENFTTYSNKFYSTLLDAKYETLTVVSGYKVYMKLRIRNLVRIDFMQYKCVAKNALGYSDGSITLYGE